jgi:hypothetical protein
MNTTPTLKPTDNYTTAHETRHGLVQPARPSTRYICALALTFPCLRYKREHFHPEKWDACHLERASRKWSTGEAHCVNFLLAVWSGHDWKADEGAGIPDRSFSLIAAMKSGLSDDNLRPIVQWTLQPHFP